MLRDFGFGTPTGAEFPGESRGDPGVPGSLAADVHPGQHGDGLRVRVTPVQLAAAYGAIANDGVLLAPTLVREVRRPGGHCSTATSPSRCGGWSARRSRRSSASSCARRWAKGGTGEHGAARELLRAREDRHRHPVRERPLRAGAVHGVLRGALSRRPPAARRDREDRQPAGQLLRRPHRRAGDADDAAAGARLAPGGDRPRPPHGARHRRSPRRRSRWPRRRPARRRSWSRCRTGPPESAPPRGRCRTSPGARSARRRWRCTGGGSG